MDQATNMHGSCDMSKPSSHSRTIQLVRSPAVDGVGVFVLREGKRASYYAIHEIPCEIGGRAFAAHRLGLGTLYHIRVGGPDECSCECLGFLRHGHCKHIDGLQVLLESRLLPESLTIQ